MKIKQHFFLFLWYLLSVPLAANNIQVSNVIITGNNPAGGFALVQFDLSWENSWRTSSVPNNWDAAWVFIKYREVGGEWHHALLNDTGYSTGTGTGSILEIGLKDDKSAFHLTSNPGIGAMIYRDADGSGTFSASNIQLRWNYSANGISTVTTVEAKVFAVEMVLIPGGSYELGDGVALGSFRQIASNVPFQVGSAGAALKVGNTLHDDTQIEGNGIWVDGDEGISKSSDSATDMNADFPTGFRGFYCMKYELSQGEYRDFLNMLTRTQQNLRTRVDISGTSVTNRYIMNDATSPGTERSSIRCDASLPATGPVVFYCDLDMDEIGNESNDGEWLACSRLGWGDCAAYLDWIGLRPISEIEYEKASRGPISAVSGEFAWGTAGIVGAIYTRSNPGEINEEISNNYSLTDGNAGVNTSHINMGVSRVGIFASNNLNTNRVSSGASYYGVMELSGSVWEHAVTVGNTTGRSYTGLHGDGELNTSGDADVSNWPGADAIGSGRRGGAWSSGSGDLRTSDRNTAARAETARGSDRGLGRGCRSVLPSSSAY